MREWNIFIINKPTVEKNERFSYMSCEFVSRPWNRIEARLVITNSTFYTNTRLRRVGAA